jgi:uncharacterized protein YndB with AHSA1/START domain
MTSSTEYKATIDLTADTDILITRTFQAPAALVYSAMTTPEHVRRWWGAGHGEVTTCEIDLRVGGAWRFVLTQPDGSEVAFSGEYLELDPPGRMVHTERYEAVPAPPSTVTTSYDEHDGATTMRALCRYDSKETRDAVIASGMEIGMNASYDAIDALLPTLR